MRYWVYINDKVEGPFTEDKLVTLEGFTPDTLICSEDAANSGNQEWVKASSIFEFDQVTEAAQETASVNANESSSHHDEVPTVLLSRLDSLNKQLADLQSKLDNIQFKLDESISTQQKSSSEAAARDAALAAQVNTLFIPQPNRNIPAAPQVLPPSQTQKIDSAAAAEKTASIPASAAKPLPEEETLSSSISLDLDNDGDLTDSELTDQKENDVVLNAALTSMQDQHIVQDEQENTFQDLLTPEQAKDLAEEAAAKKQQAQQAEVKSPSDDDAQKQAVLAEFSSPNSNEEVIDQIIKEKEEEQSQEKDKRSISQRIAAGAAALAATFAALKGGQKKEELVPNEPSAPTENSQHEPTQPAEPAAPADVPSVEPLEQQAPAQPAEQEVTNAQPPAPQPMQPVEAEQPINEVLPSEPQPNQSLPSLDDNLASAQAVQDEKEATLQELVPGAENDKTEGIITEEDLKEVFVDRAPQEDASIDQLLGTAPTVEPAAPQAVPEPDLDMPSLSAVSSDKPAETAMPEGNPNDLTEIELKEGSTYLISDFVPPASSKELEAAYAKKMQGNQPGAPNPAAKHETKENKADDTQEIQEMVSAAPQPEQPQQPQQPAETAAAEKPAPQNNTPTDVTVSSIVLENTIKPKRGAALDIKTVPMVPEPANSDRIQLEGMDDGINTQHDLQSADIKPAGKTTKMVVGVLIMLLLGGAIYAILGFMNLIPAKYNLLSSQQQVEAQQNAQLDEMLGTEEEQPAQEPSEQMQQPMQDEFAPVEPQQEAITDPKEMVRTEVQNYLLSNGQTLKSYVESKHPAMVDVITWDVKDSASADNYTVWIKVPPENPQSFKSNYVFNYNLTTKVLQPTTSETKNFVSAVMGNPTQPTEF